MLSYPFLKQPWDSKGEVPLTKLGIQDLDAYLDWRGEQEGELLPDSALFVSCSNRSQGKRLSYWGIRHVMDDLAEKTGIDLHSHRGRHTFATNLIELSVNSPASRARRTGLDRSGR